jgi:DNA topoisomerase-2
VREFFSVKDYNAWLASDEAASGSWMVKYYKGLGTSTAVEGRQYFSDLPRHRKQFTWSGSADGDEIVKAFAKSQVCARACVCVRVPKASSPER